MSRERLDLGLANEIGDIHRFSKHLGESCVDRACGHVYDPDDGRARLGVACEFSRTIVKGAQFYAGSYSWYSIT